MKICVGVVVTLRCTMSPSSLGARHITNFCFDSYHIFSRFHFLNRDQFIRESSYRSQLSVTLKELLLYKFLVGPIR